MRRRRLSNKATTITSREREKKEDAKKYTAADRKFYFSGGQMLFSRVQEVPNEDQIALPLSKKKFYLFLVGRLEHWLKGKWGHKTIKGLLALLAKSFGSLVSVWVVVLSFSTSLKWSIVR